MVHMRRNIKTKNSYKIIETFEYEIIAEKFNKDWSIAKEIKFINDCPWIDCEDIPKRKHLKKTIKILKNK